MTGFKEVEDVEWNLGDTEDFQNEYQSVCFL
jgi:hypothetical protein